MRPLLSRRWRGAVATSVLAASFATAAVVAPSPFALAAGRVHAEPKPGSLAALKADVQRTTDRLAAATLAYEQGQVQLGSLISRKVSTERTVEELQQEAGRAEQRVSTLANSLYRNPVDPAVRAVLDGNIRSVTDLQFLKRRAQQTSSDQRRDAALLTSRVADTQQLLAQQDAAAAGAITLQSNLDDALARLQADAVASQRRLVAAVAELRRRQRAVALRAFGVEGGPSCSAPVPPEAINGFLPPSALCPLAASPGHSLIAKAANAFDRMSAAFAADLGAPLCVTDSYRDYAGQVSVFRRKPNLAATPGRSVHGLGRALDLCGGVQTFGTPAYLWLKLHASEYGFVHPSWAEPGGGKPEPWHWEYEG